MFGHDGDLVAVHAQDLALQVDQLSLADLHVVSGLQVVLSLLTCRQTQVSLGSWMLFPEAAAEAEMAKVKQVYPTP